MSTQMDFRPRRSAFGWGFLVGFLLGAIAAEQDRSKASYSITQQKGKTIMASILERMRAKLDEVKESGVDLNATGQSMIFRAGSYDNEGNYKPAVTEFDSVYEGEPCRAGLELHEERLTEVNLGRQRQGKSGAKTDDWMLALEMTIACRGARLGIVEDGTFYPLPIYEDPAFSGFTSQTPLVFTQLLRANYSIDESIPQDDPEWARKRIVEGPALNEFKQLLDKAGFIARKFAESDYVAQRDRLWSIEAPNPQTGDYGRDLEEKVSKGLPLASFSVRPPDPERSEEYANQFEDPFQAWNQNIDDALMMLTSNDRNVQRNARKLVSSLTGATRQDGLVYSGRATVGEIEVLQPHTQTIGNITQTVQIPIRYSFWSRGGAPAMPDTPRL